MVPSTTRATSRLPPSWSESSLTLRPKSTSPPASAVTSSSAFTRHVFADEASFSLGAGPDGYPRQIRAGYQIVVEGVRYIELDDDFKGDLQGSHSKSSEKGEKRMVGVMAVTMHAWMSISGDDWICSTCRLLFFALI